ncbi:hypothetical protein PanWU01x14_161900 [Parasponia andersonii]|uniref:Uncharacterized protein n=1 Tax=Parasponia andersonii TaxID=3476 RepID=A0A2P5CDH8_PARAD|nr:hypothetical protein PanWU01x14_161900 [Parasponia andersonii]
MIVESANLERPDNPLGIETAPLVTRSNNPLGIEVSFLVARSDRILGRGMTTLLVSRSGHTFGIVLKIAETTTKSSTRDILRDLGLLEGEEPEVIITQPRESAEVSWTSSSSLRANEEGEDGPEASGHKADVAFLADSDNKFRANDVANIVILRTLNRNCMNFLIPSRMHMRALYEGEDFVPEVLFLGLRFPLHLLLRVYLVDWGIALGQLSPNGLRTLGGCFGRPERRQYPVLSKDELFNLKTLFVMDKKECHFKGLLMSSTLALVGWHLYLTSNPLLRKHDIIRPVHLEVDDMISNVKESLATVREALIP